MYKLLTFLLLFNVLSNHGFAQLKISGRVVDSLNLVGLQGASIRLLSNRDSVISGTSSGINGTFGFLAPAAGNYKIQANFLGYKPQGITLRVDASGKGQQLTLLLSSAITELEAIEITAPAPTVVLKGDTTEFNAAAFSTEPYADADALIGQLPGVEIDADGNVLAQGEQVQRIIVDGKEFFSTDPRIALKTLPADIIDKIQLIDEKSEQAQFTGFDDGQRRKIINIVTKPDRRHGYFGRFSGAYGNQERYNTGGNINFFNGERRLSVMGVSNNINQNNFSMAEIGASEDGGGGGNRGGRGGRGGGGQGGGSPGNATTNNLSANYNNEWLDDKIDLNADYTFNTRDNRVNSLSNRQTFVTNGDDQFRTQQSWNNSTNNSHRANFKLEIEPDTIQSFNFDPSFSFQQNNRLNSSTSNTVYESLDPLNASERNNDNRNSNFNISGNLNYRLRLGKPGRTISLSANGSYNSNRGLAQSLSMSQFYKDELLDRTDTVNSQNDANGYGNGLTGRLAYTEPLGKNNRLQANYSIRNTANYSNRETFDFLAETGQYSELNRQLSNEFQNDYVYHSGGLSNQWSFEKLSFDYGVDFQLAGLQNQKTFPDNVLTRRNFSSYLPGANLMYRFSREENLRLEYRTATNAPSIDQLQDVINNQNQLNIRTGNPDLKQEYQHRFNLRFNRVNRETGANINASVDAEFSNDRVVNSVVIAKEDTYLTPEVLLAEGAQFIRPENVDGFSNLRANASYGTPIKVLKININVTTGAYRTRDVGLMNNTFMASNSYGINQRVAVNSHISQKLIFSFSYAGNYSVVNNSTNKELSRTYYNQVLRNDFTWIFWKGVRINSSVMYNYNTGLGDGFDQNFILWNASVGKKLFGREEGEIALSAYDLLNKNTNISRDISESYIQDSQSNMLRQYFILSFTYNLRKFGGGGGRKDGGAGPGRRGGLQNN